jgi:O-antigen/teichoic acid export membrane protein
VRSRGTRTRQGQKLSRFLRYRKELGATLMASADITAKVVVLLITPYLANRMGAAEFGSLNLAMASTDILAFLLFLGGPALIAAEYVREGEAAALRLRAASMRISLRIAPALLIACIAASRFLPSVVPFAIAILTVALGYMYGLNALEIAFYRGAQNYSLAIVGQFTFTLLNLLLTIAAFELVAPTAANRLLSLALAGAVVQLVYAVDLHRRTNVPSDAHTRRASTKLVITFGLSISVHVACHWARLSVDRFVLAGYGGLATAGVYSVALTMAMVPSIFFSVVSQQLQPFLYRRLKEGRFSEFRKIQIVFALLVILATAVYYVFLLLFFDRVFSSEYHVAKSLLLPLLGGSMAQGIYFVFAHAAFYERRGSYISVLAAVSLAVHLLGLGALVLSGEVTMFNVALVYLSSGAVTTIVMAGLSNRIVRQLSVNQKKE